MMPEPVRCLVVEDEDDAVGVLRRYLQQTPGYALEVVCNNTAAAGQVLLSRNIDLVFLDINLPGATGVDWLRSHPGKHPVILTTADPGFAIEGFELDAIDYLLKPFSYHRFRQSLDRYGRYRAGAAAPVAEPTAPMNRPFVMVRSERLLQKIFFDELRFIEAKRNHLIFQCDTQSVRVYQSMGAVDEQLPGTLFLRIHRSFIVAVARITAFSATAVWLSEEKLPIGRLYQKTVHEVLSRGDAIRRTA